MTLYCLLDFNIIENFWRLIKQRIGSYEKIITTLDDIKYDGSTIRGADGSTYSEHGRSPVIVE